MIPRPAVPSPVSLAAGVDIGDSKVLAGVGVPGLVEPDSGHVTHAVNLDDSDGCLETLASGTVIAAAWPSSNGLAPASALFSAAAAGDEAACAVRDTFAGHVASAVRLLVLTCDVETVVPGGGVTEVGRPLIDAGVAAYASGDSAGLTVPR